MRLSKHLPEYILTFLSLNHYSVQKGPLTTETKFGLSSCSLTVFDLIYTCFFFNGEGKSCMTSRVYFSVKEMEKLKEGLKRVGM